MASHQSTPYGRAGKDDGICRDIALCYSSCIYRPVGGGESRIGGSNKTIGGRHWRLRYFRANFSKAGLGIWLGQHRPDFTEIRS